MGSHKDKLDTALVLCATIVFLLGIPSGLSAQSTQTTTGVDVGNVVEMTREKEDRQKPKDRVEVDPKSTVSPTITVKGEIKTTLPIKDPTGHLPQQVSIAGEKVIPVTGTFKKKPKTKASQTAPKKASLATKAQASAEGADTAQVAANSSQSEAPKAALTVAPPKVAEAPPKSPLPVMVFTSLALLALGGTAFALTGGAKFISNLGVPDISAEGHLGDAVVDTPSFESSEDTEDVPAIGYIVAMGVPKVSLTFIEHGNGAD